MAAAQGGYLERPKPSGLADVIEIILDKGIVIDAYVRISLIGIELITIDARIVIASVDTYLRFAEAVNRLNITDDGSPGPARDHGEHRGEGREDQDQGRARRASRRSSARRRRRRRREAEQPQPPADVELAVEESQRRR